MSHQQASKIIFIQGGGEDGYPADKPMVDSLEQSLGEKYSVSYPELTSDESKSDFGWIKQIEEAVTNAKKDVILVGHSLGASLILKYLSEQKVGANIVAVFLISTPFWSGDEDWKQGLILEKDFADKLPKSIPIYFYQTKDDEETPFQHFEWYKQKISNARFHALDNGGHQLNNDLTVVARDIKSLPGPKS